MSLLQTALDFLGWHGEGEDEEDVYPTEDYPDPAIGSGEPELPADSDVIPLRAERSEFAGVTIIRADPKNMEQATAVADEIKRRKPVILNLQSAMESEATRIRDFIGGVTYGLNGYMRRIAEWVYVCAPFDMPVEKMVLDGAHFGGSRYEEADRRSFSEL